jgi:hypothetical protein
LLRSARAQQFVERYVQCRGQPEDDLATRQPPRFLPVRERSLWYTGPPRQFLLRQLPITPEVLEPGSIGIATRFRFSTHAPRMLERGQKGSCVLAMGC